MNAVDLEAMLYLHYYFILYIYSSAHIVSWRRNPMGIVVLTVLKHTFWHLFLFLRLRMANYVLCIANYVLCMANYVLCMANYVLQTVLIVSGW